MDVFPNQTGRSAPKANWLESTLRQFNFVASMRERRQIRQICVDTLGLYRKIASESPNAPHTELYARILRDGTGADSAAVQKAMRRAEESFATWPVERPLNLRDIVQYLVMTDSLKQDIAVAGVQSRVVDLAQAIVIEKIPANL